MLAVFCPSWGGGISLELEKMVVMVGGEGGGCRGCDRVSLELRECGHDDRALARPYRATVCYSINKLYYQENIVLEPLMYKIVV